ncbi:uncharacterized protein B0I36DRAFT_330813 [Microdochium trichocladiopsis]|uniref:Uncharacterized protein n=1 Tax=Microdochium trichocladiopsis TaxID=1682393 RepID=A0A9P8Y0G1_9PEZI|nr:uncharacterized protein B0I36DRAFT_330813 [Microdochium trichocladiopsis]KAH7026524.1 hypothetical protein B0I36DRAFT_330813 [Microdochium trichocladiopsis]
MIPGPNSPRSPTTFSTTAGREAPANPDFRAARRRRSGKEGSSPSIQKGHRLIMITISFEPRMPIDTLESQSRYFGAHLRPHGPRIDCLRRPQKRDSARSTKKQSIMCMKASCSVCGKTSWFGCGAHIPGVLDAIPNDQWCTCTPKVEVGAKEYPPKAGTGTATSSTAAS